MIPAWLEELAKWGGALVAIGSFIKWVVKPILDIKASVHTVDEKLDVVQDDVADMQCHLLNQAYDEHVENKGWCRRDEKERLTEMCDKYTRRGRNHLAERYTEKLLALPEHPPGR